MIKLRSLKEILRVFMTLQWTKELPRQGFLFFGFKRNEVDSVAAHTYTTTFLADLEFKGEMFGLVKEYNERKTLEAKLVKVCDNLDALALATTVPGADMKYFYPSKKLIDPKSPLNFYKSAAELILKRGIKPFREWTKDA